jgi:hypothetical protein
MESVDIIIKAPSSSGIYELLVLDTADSVAGWLAQTKVFSLASPPSELLSLPTQILSIKQVLITGSRANVMTLLDGSTRKNFGVEVLVKPAGVADYLRLFSGSLVAFISGPGAT